jgi:hypothetical protein
MLKYTLTAFGESPLVTRLLGLADVSGFPQQHIPGDIGIGGR